jgi:hypothetical protein
MNLTEIIRTNPEIFATMGLEAINIGADSETVAEYWYEETLGTERCEAENLFHGYVIRLVLWETGSGDVHAQIEFVNVVQDDGDIDRTIVPMCNLEDMQAFLKKEAMSWKVLEHLDVSKADKIFRAAEAMRLRLSDTVLCTS